MPKKKPIEIGVRFWEFQKDALKHYQDILSSYEIDDELIGEDFNEIFDLIKNHPSAEEKIGNGVASIVVKGDAYGSKCFHIIRKDGSQDNFSYRKAVVGEARPFTKFCQACRKAVEQDISNLKTKYFLDENDFPKNQAKCQETGIEITRENSHVDHRHPNTFSVIVDRFIEIEHIDLNSVSYETEGQYGRIFRDEY